MMWGGLAHTAPASLYSVPRLSNGSEWLFHGKDEVRDVQGDIEGSGGAQGVEGTNGAQGDTGGMEPWRGGQRVSDDAQGIWGWPEMSMGTEGG